MTTFATPREDGTEAHDPGPEQLREEVRLDVRAVGIEFIVWPAGAEIGENELVFDVIGRPRGFITNRFTSRHVHPTQHERYEVLAGEMLVEHPGGIEHLHRGDSFAVPPGTPHRQLPAGDAPGHVRVRVTPPGRTEEYLRTLSELSTNGRFGHLGLPGPLTAARLVRDYGDVGHGAAASLAAQRRAAAVVLAIAGGSRPLRLLLGSVARRIFRAYEFVDEWEVAAPAEAIYAVLADGRTYPAWWRPVYIDVESDGPPTAGSVSLQHFKGRLPYHLHTRSRLVRLEPGRLIEAEVDGDLRGRGIWTLTPIDSGARTHVRFDWTVHADRPLLKLLTPVLRPALRANHNWAIARAIEGLQPYVQARATGARL